MTSAKTDAERIAAWREQRASIAAADEAALRERAARGAKAAPTGPVAVPDPVAPAPESPPESPPEILTETTPEQVPPPVADSTGKTAATTVTQAETRRQPGAAFLEKLRGDRPARPRPPRRAPPATRLFLALVALPMLLVATYLFAIATPLYEARSVVAITRPGDAGTGVKAGLLGGEKPANLQDVFRADTYIKSQALMAALERESGLVTELGSDAIDPLRRLRAIPFLSISQHDQFDRFVQSSVDVQSGLLTLYVRAPGHDRAIGISEAVLRNAETQVARLGQALFDQRRSDAAQMRRDAEAQVKQAQEDLLKLQLRFQDVDPRERIENIYARIRELEDEVYRTRNEIRKLEIAGVGESRQTAKLQALVVELDSQISEQRAQLVLPGGTSATPLNNMLIEYERAILDLDLAREAVKTAIGTEAEANREAALNRSIFQVVVPPGTAEAALYPRRFTVLAMTLVLCLAGFAAVRTFRNGRS